MVYDLNGAVVVKRKGKIISSYSPTREFIKNIFTEAIPETITEAGKTPAKIIKYYAQEAIAPTVKAALPAIMPLAIIGVIGLGVYLVATGVIKLPKGKM